MKSFCFKLVVCVLFVCLLLALYSCSEDNHTHSLTYHAGIAPECTQVGNVEYWHCDGCGKSFSDDKANNEIDDVVLSPSHALVHNEAVASSCTENGSIEYWFCTECNKSFLDEAATSEVNDTVVFAAHKLVFNEAVLPSCNKNGASEHWMCTECNVKFSDSKAETVLHSVLVPGEHNFINGVCEKCMSEGTPGLIYELNDGQYAVTGIESIDVLRIVIPSSYKGVSVVSIADNAFQNCSELMSIEISENITEIGEGVFDGCNRLVEIVNNSDVSISYSHKNFMEIHTGETKLKNVQGYLFYVVSDLYSYLVGYVGEESNLVLPEKFVIDDSIKILQPLELKTEDFDKTFIIPLLNEVELLMEKHCRSAYPDASFSFFDNESYIQYEYGCINCSAKNGVRAYLNDMKKIYRTLTREEYKELEEIYDCINILIANYSTFNPQKYMNIENAAHILEKMYEDYPITKQGIAITVYTGASNITSRQNLANIIEKYFSDYTYQLMYEQENAVGYNRYDNTYRIAAMAFSGRDELISISIPKSVVAIESQSFTGCSKLANITVSEENVNYSSINGDLYSADGKQLIVYAPGKEESTFVVPAGVETIEMYAFKDHNIESIIIPEGVTEIKPCAFYRLQFESEDNVIKIVLPETVTKIGDEAFAYTNLAEITLPDSLVEIGNYAFRNNGLEKIHLPEKVTSIGIGAFSGNRITSITVDEKNTVYHATANCLISTAQKILVLGAINSQIPNDGSVEIIGCQAFAHISELKSIHIPSCVLYIMSGAFAGDSNFLGITYDGDAFFFVSDDIVYENGVYVSKYTRGDDYDSESSEHKTNLVFPELYDASLCRVEEKIEYYVEIYKNYIQ